MSCPEIGLHKSVKIWKGHSRVSSSKWQSIYSEEFKRFVCNDYLTGSMTKSEVESKHNISNGRLTYWLREKDYVNLKSRIVSLPNMKFDKNTASKKKSQKSITEQELQEAKFLAEAYRKMIQIAEKEFKINIVKKNNNTKFASPVRPFRLGWQNGYHAEHIYSNKFIRQKLDYIHNKPVKDEIVTLPEDYYFSSARNYVSLGNDLGVIVLCLF